MWRSLVMLLFFLPSGEVILPYDVKLLVFSLLVQSIGSAVAMIQMPEQPLEFGDLVVSHVVPYLERREVSPFALLGLGVHQKASTDASSRHPHVDDVVVLNACLFPAAIEHIKTPAPAWHI